MVPKYYSEAIQGAFHAAGALLEDVGVDHRRRNILMAKEFLDGADVGSALEGMGGKTMAEYMT